MNIFKWLFGWGWWKANDMDIAAPPHTIRYAPDYEKIEGENVKVFNKNKYAITITMKSGEKETWKWNCPSKRDRTWNTLFNNDRAMRVNGVEGFATFEHGLKTVAIARDRILYGEKQDAEPITAKCFYYAYGQGRLTSWRTADITKSLQ